MKKIIVLLLLILCFSFSFAIGVKPYLVTLDLHPLILNGFCPTYAGVGLDFSHAENPLHVKASIAGGVYERGFYQNPKTGEYILMNNDPVQLTDLLNLEWEAKAEYPFNETTQAFIEYWGVYEKRSVWEKNKTTERWLGGSEKTILNTDINHWVESLGGNSYYPELGTESSVFHTVKAGFEYNRMFDNMVANDGYIIKANLVYAPGVVNKGVANFVNATADVIVAKEFFDLRFDNGNCKLALSIIDRINLNYMAGTIPARFQESSSLGYRVRGFDTGSYANTASVVNNFEVRLSGPAVSENVFLRSDFFFDVGYGFGKIVNTNTVCKDLLISIGWEEMIDYNDAFDLGLEVAYLINGKRMSNPTHPLQIGATFFLAF